MSEKNIVVLRRKEGSKLLFEICVAEPFRRDRDRYIESIGSYAPDVNPTAMCVIYPKSAAEWFYKGVELSEPINHIFETIGLGNVQKAVELGSLSTEKACVFISSIADKDDHMGVSFPAEFSRKNAGFKGAVFKLPVVSFSHNEELTPRRRRTRLTKFRTGSTIESGHLFSTAASSEKSKEYVEMGPTSVKKESYKMTAELGYVDPELGEVPVKELKTLELDREYQFVVTVTFPSAKQHQKISENFEYIVSSDEAERTGKSYNKLVFDKNDLAKSQFSIIPRETTEGIVSFCLNFLHDNLTVERLQYQFPANSPVVH